MPVSDSLHHTALLYRNPMRLRTAAAGFLSQATTSGQPLLAVLPAHNHVLLDDVLADPAARVTRVDAGEIGRNPSRLIPIVLDWLAAQDGPASILSESAWPDRGAAEITECLRHEALVNHALAQAPVRMLCPFDAEQLDGEVIAGAEMTHPWLIDEDGERRSGAYGDPLELARGDHWPQAEPRPPVSELAFEGDLWALRRTLADAEQLARLTPDRREDLVFAVNEAASNAVRHGDGTCRTRLWGESDRVVSEVATSSAIEDPLAGRRTPDLEGIGGRGLWLINRVCDLVEIRNGPNGASVRMHVAVAA